MTKKIELVLAKDESGNSISVIQFRDIRIVDGKEVYHRSVYHIDDAPELPASCDIVLDNNFMQNADVKKTISGLKKKGK